ncbi:dopamine receptor 2-like [Acanthaster planci]|uniref:Dopamine receptor 2-like n=1 Tax=Acanthaster planci TaxID=133434 RepID=A0A8B7XWJ5_ACAPL|nr:dopamine receptor 2-like [Acanthaster planci]
MQQTWPFGRLKYSETIYCGNDSREYLEMETECVYTTVRLDERAMPCGVSTANSEILSVQNHTLSGSTEDDPDLTFFVVYVFAILLPLSLFIVTGNSVVVFAVCNSNASVVLQKATNMFVVSLAVSDCLVGVSLVPVFYLGIFIDSLKSSFYVCLVITSFLHVSCGISMLHVLGIAGDRFVAVMYPLLYHSHMTQRRTTIAVALTWCLAIGVGLTPYLGWRKPARKLEFCYIDQVLPFSYVLFSFILTFAVPLFAMAVIYTKITLAARRHVRRIAALSAAPVSRSVESASRKGDGQSSVVVKSQKIFSVGDMKAITTTAIVVGVFVLCWLPAYVFNFVMHHRNSVRPAGSELLRSPLVEAALNTLAFSNSAVNPIIYAYRYKEFRRGIRKVLARFCRRVCFSVCAITVDSRQKRQPTVINLEQITVNPSSETIGHRQNSGYAFS